MAASGTLRGILFDLDGTLLDTAEDLIGACNGAVVEFGLQPAPPSELKPQISSGASAMLERILEIQRIDTDRVDRHDLLRRMLELYEENIAVRTRVFASMDEVLDTLDTRAIPWGIVTNKVERFTQPLLRALNFSDRPGCVISGDTYAEKKPHPLPMIEASRQLRCEPHQCAYLGDARRDVEAGRNAGMTTLAASYGYVDPDDPAEAWGADAIIHHPLQLLDWLDGGRR